MILQALKNMYPKASEKVLQAVMKDLEKCRGKNMSTDEQKEIFEKFHDCWSEYASKAQKAIFSYAFKLGARLVLETLTG